MKYKKILVAIDHSPESDAVFEQALEIAKKEEASLMVFHCLPLETEGAGFYGDMFGRELIDFAHLMQEKMRKESEKAREWLASYCEKATGQGVQTEWDCKVGDAGSAIRDLANSWGADLIVLGRRGRRGLQEILLGSISNYIVHHVPCSILIVQGINSKVDDTANLQDE
ncbi:MAG TPA: universal stress protein [Cyanobacteria bacterium UBA12227]|nr:universal stress protein [Cyanobacteria bacterium UBA12227]HAX86559.1 universal stress protein [Cyanobacteria bacterium UBA11370]HBY76247.1 universal stress protein [Cyanobacteria bacterium UBA11148]